MRQSSADEETSPLRQKHSDWIDALLQTMNEGQSQGGTDATTETETPTDDRGTSGADTGIPRGTEQDISQGTSDRRDTGTPETPESPSGMARTQQGRTDRDESGGTQGDTDGLQLDD